MATLAASSVSDDSDSDSSQLVCLLSPSLPQTLPIPRNPKFNLLHGRRSIWFPSLLFRGARDRISASRALDAVTVVGIDFALPLLQVQRGKHMGFSRYFLLAPSACCSLPLSISLCSHPNICPRFSLVIALEKQCQACFPRSCFHGQLDPALQKSNSQTRFSSFALFFRCNCRSVPDLF